VTATAKLIRACDTVAMSQANNGKKVFFHGEQNQWAVYGAILDANQEVTVTNLNMGRGFRTMIGVGDDRALDIDMWLLDNNGRVLREDVLPDAIPVVNFDVGNHPSYGLRFRNLRATGPSVILATILDIVD
jgi:hypothetical protein